MKQQKDKSKSRLNDSHDDIIYNFIKQESYKNKEYILALFKNNISFFLCWPIIIL